MIYRCGDDITTHMCKDSAAKRCVLDFAFVNCLWDRIVVKDEWAIMQKMAMQPLQLGIIQFLNSLTRALVIS